MEEEKTIPAGAPTGVAAHSAASDMPAEIKGWNWGAFFLNWIWGIGNRVWLALLTLVLAFIPVVGTLGVIVMMVVLGLKGSEWAWKSRSWESVEQFKKVQKTWAIWGLIIFILSLLLMIFAGGALLALIAEGGSFETFELEN
jgi:hypothetical protein